MPTHGDRWFGQNTVKGRRRVEHGLLRDRARWRCLVNSRSDHARGAEAQRIARSERAANLVRDKAILERIDRPLPRLGSVRTRRSTPETCERSRGTRRRRTLPSRLWARFPARRERRRVIARPRMPYDQTREDTHG